MSGTIAERPPVWREELKLRYSDGDRWQYLKPRALFDLAQEAAVHHAELLGCGMSELQRTGRTWVLSRTGFRILRTPRPGETVTVETWPSGIERLFARRQYRMLDASGAEWCVGSSLWVLLDIEKKRILMPQAIMQEEMPKNADRPVYFPDLAKLPEPEDDGGETPEFRVGEAQIDSNGHLNNAEYAALAQDFLALRTGGRAWRITEIQVNYLHGCPMGSSVRIHGNLKDTEFALSGECGGDAAFRMAGTVRFC